MPKTAPSDCLTVPDLSLCEHTFKLKSEYRAIKIALAALKYDSAAYTALYTHAEMLRRALRISMDKSRRARMLQAHALRLIQARARPKRSSRTVAGSDTLRLHRGAKRALARGHAQRKQLINQARACGLEHMVHNLPE